MSQQVSMVRVAEIVLDVLKSMPGRWLTARDILGVCEGLAGPGTKSQPGDVERVNRALWWLRQVGSAPVVHKRRSRREGRPYEYMVEASK